MATLVFALGWWSDGISQSFRSIELQSKLIHARDNNGVAVADYDLDGDLDVFLVVRQDFDHSGAGLHSQLFRNNNDGTFTDVTQISGIVSSYDYTNVKLTEDIGMKMGASWGDYNNDGFPDLLLTSVHHVQLYINEGSGTFLEVTAQAGISPDSECLYVGGLWWDYNSDGFLDIYLSKWEGCNTNELYKNIGGNRFVNVTFSSGIVDSNAENPTGRDPSWMGIPIDANQDGLMDLYVANDFSVNNRLYIQQQGGTFIESATIFGVQDPNTNGMGIAIGDYNNDGNFDFYVTNIGSSTLFENTGRHFFTDRAVELGVVESGWAWGTQFADFDHDGDEDLMVVNGYGLESQNFLYKNRYKEGENTFENITKKSGVADTSDSNALAVFDYDNDGDLDMLISNSDKHLVFYENEISENNDRTDKNWLKIQLEGTTSNRDAIGTVIEVVAGNDNPYRFHHGSGFLSQNLQPVHFGLGGHSLVEKLKILWPSGKREEYHDVPVNKTIHAIEGEGYTVLELSSNKIYGCTDPNSCSYNPNATFNDGSCNYLPSKEITGKTFTGNLRVEVYSYPQAEGSSYKWEVTGGEIVEGQGSPVVKVKWGIGNTGTLKVTESNDCQGKPVEVLVNLATTKLDEKHSIARLWNEALLDAIRNDYARPTIHARNLFHASIAMYDAWAVYDPKARPYLLGNHVQGFKTPFDGFETDILPEQARNMSISYAAYRLLSHRFRHSPNEAETKENFDDLMESLAYDVGFTSTNYTNGDPAALGNYIAESIIRYGHTDGAREAYQYNNAHYGPVNPPMIPIQPGNKALLDPNRWQPLKLDVFIDQSGNSFGGAIRKFLSPEWGSVNGFALSADMADHKKRNGADYHLFFDPGSPPLLDTVSATSSSKSYQWNFSLVSVWSSHLDPTDGVMWDISPKSIGNYSPNAYPRELMDYVEYYDLLQGGDGGQGRGINQITGQPYQEQLVPRGDYTRVLAEFWADGPDSETPPGHWFVLLNAVNDNPMFEKRMKGEGMVLDNLEWDVKAYFALGGAMHDAAIAAWSIKGWYDYIRPISAIRYMAERGQSTDVSLANYDIAGLPLIDGYIEVVKAGDQLAGDEGEHIGKIKLYAWRGHGAINNTHSDQAGVSWILAENWWPYQRPTFVTPPFAGYVSGHSTFSRAAAEVLSLLTGSEYFPGGMGEFVARKNEFLVFEEGPSQDVVLQWATYRDASDQCSLSRIWGGIHPPVDDIPGRLIGIEIGNKAFDHAFDYFENKVLGFPDLESDWSIYPNPVGKNRELTVTGTLKGQSLEIRDLLGRKIPIDRQVFDHGNETIRLNIQQAIPGIYILKTKNSSRKFLVE